MPNGTASDFGAVQQSVRDGGLWTNDREACVSVQEVGHWCPECLSDQPRRETSWMEASLGERP
ncbi:unnamed protein product [Nesidiocoris tenuis]|uniref:Uncharacterized protein n=1 Tax=Nesidiocoris tenuis TaxID=355587 RepID=A0A6H5FXL6_9HEMI|nr:unnamed protein product [Nesidiocoris tenuis]